jgi:hypothetical protein
VSQTIYPLATTTDWIKIKEVSLSTNTYPLSVTGLNLTADLAYFVIAYIGNSDTTYSQFLILYFNGDTTYSNYKCRHISADSTTISTSLDTYGPQFGPIAPNKFNTFFLFLSMREGKVVADILPYSYIAGATSPPRTNIETIYHISATNLTSLQFYLGYIGPGGATYINLLAGSKVLVFKPRLG